MHLKRKFAINKISWSASFAALPSRTIDCILVKCEHNLSTFKAFSYYYRSNLKAHIKKRCFDLLPVSDGKSERDGGIV